MIQTNRSEKDVFKTGTQAVNVFWRYEDLYFERVVFFVAGICGKRIILQNI
jgi:hypothetical protein